MIGFILDALYHCCCHRQRVTTETVIDHLERLAEHEVRYIVNKFGKSKSFHSCC